MFDGSCYFSTFAHGRTQGSKHGIGSKWQRTGVCASDSWTSASTLTLDLGFYLFKGPKPLKLSCGGHK